jgi:hypothetical protein
MMKHLKIYSVHQYWCSSFLCSLAQNTSELPVLLVQLTTASCEEF